jgi:WXG100 family type VII secretion target
MTIIVNYPVLEQTSVTLNNASSFLDNNLGELRGRLQNLDWDGDDATAYAEAQRRWDNAQTNLNTLLGQIGMEVENAKDRFRRNEMRGAQQWG